LKAGATFRLSCLPNLCEATTVAVVSWAAFGRGDEASGDAFMGGINATATGTMHENAWAMPWAFRFSLGFVLVSLLIAIPAMHRYRR
jgi:hypothetical protein